MVTGDLEKLALHDSLRQYFPGECDGKPVTWLLPRKTEGATTRRLPPPAAVYGPMRRLAETAIVELEIGRTGKPADLVVVIDDGELGNLGDGQHVAAHFRLAMIDVINTRAPDPAANTALRQKVRDRLSFHILMPMVEAHFYMKRAGLAECGVLPEESPVLANTDCEQFESADSLWLPTCRDENAHRAAAAPWWRHECHPKHYLQHLLDRSDAGFYVETSEAAQCALKRTQWRGYASAEGQFARSLFEDLSLWFGVPNPMGGGACAASTWPTITTKAGSLLLRNL